MLVDVACR
jgi:hypothetical protein